jgi:hypothetical protein
MACAGLGLLTAGEVSRYIVDGRRSGYTYLSEENQRLQDDDFANPGLLGLSAAGNSGARQTVLPHNLVRVATAMRPTA